MQQRERDIFLRLGNEVHETLRQQRAHMVHDQQQLVQEGEAKINFVRLLVESEQRASWRTLESVSQDMVRQEAQHFRDGYLRSESAAHLFGDEVQPLTLKLQEARESSEYFHKKRKETSRKAIELLLTDIERRAMYQKLEKNKQEMEVEFCSNRKETMDSHKLSRVTLSNKTTTDQHHFVATNCASCMGRNFECNFAFSCNGTLCLMREAYHCYKLLVFTGVFFTMRSRYRRISQTPDPWTVTPHQPTK